MKKLFFTTVLALLTLSTIAQSQLVTISGQIQNPRTKIARVDFPSNPLVGDVESHGGMVDGSGNFKIKFSLKKPTSARFYYGDHQLDMFIEPGDRLYMFFNTVTFGKTLKFSGQGSDNNNLLAQLYAKYEEPKLKKGQPMSPPMEYRYQADRERREKLDMVLDYLLNHNVTREFAQYINAKVEYGWAIDLFDYPFKYAMATSMELVRNLPESYYSFMNDVSVYNDEVVDLPLYFNFIGSYISYRFKHSGASSAVSREGKYAKKYEFIRNELQGRPMYIALAKCLLDGIEYGKIEYITGKYMEYVKENPYKEYNDVVISAFEKASKTGAGRPAPSFRLRTPEGKMISLEDLQGKTLYVDFWATWCAPCISELPHSQKLKSQFAGTNVEFVYISVDDDIPSWTNFIDRRMLMGLHLNMNGLKCETAKAYNLSAVPRYMIIDRNGIIVDSNAKKPSDPRLIDDLKLALQR